MRLILLSLAILLFSFQNSQAKINIFACEPELAALASEIAGDKAKIKKAVSANQDAHHIRARPSLISAIRKADLVFCTGLDLEVGWLPILLEKAQESVQVGKVGNLMAGDYVKPMNIPKVIDRSHGDIHASGNPHIHLDPRNFILVAKELSKRLSEIDPENSDFYKNRFSKFNKKWSNLIKSWKIKAKPLRGMNIISHHKNWVYLAKWLNIEVIENLEPVPGITPTVKHLETLINKSKEENVKLIIRTSFDNKKASKWLSKKTDIPNIVLQYTVDDKSAKNLEELFNRIIEELLKWN